MNPFINRRLILFGFIQQENTVKNIPQSPTKAQWETFRKLRSWNVIRQSPPGRSISTHEIPSDQWY